MAASEHNPIPKIVPFSLLLISIAMTVAAAAPPCENGSGPVTGTTRLVNFLEKVQETALRSLGPDRFDPKRFVDLWLKSDLSGVEIAFGELPRSANGTVPADRFIGFVDEWFGGAGEDLVGVVPPDFVPAPEGFLPEVKNREVREWALEVHALWKNLSRRVSGEVSEKSERHTLLPLPAPAIVPGSRFREVYYWDSYWVVRGLLASKMHNTAKAIVTNLIWMIEQYGHVLNGARLYYTNRSQPPLLSSMVHEIYNRTRDMDLVQTSLPALIKEHNFWISGVHEVKIRDSEANEHSLCRYYAKWNKPRPESATIDVASASNLSSDSEKVLFYRELASAAESGWDFSTRWMRNGTDLTTLATTSILPVDLNAFVLKMELDIAFLAKVSGDHKTAEQFTRASEKRKKSIETVFWNAKSGQWLDYWLDNSNVCKEAELWKPENQNHNPFASNFIPLWLDSFHSDRSRTEKVTGSLGSSGLVRAAGIATSLTNSGQQWDFPNGWAPVQHMIVEGMARSGSKGVRSTAEEIATSWIRTNYAVYKKTGAMHEKFDVEKCGEFGGGGEYVPQVGFGWSNGVVLAFLEEFGWPEDRKIDCS